MSRIYNILTGKSIYSRIAMAYLWPNYGWIKAKDYYFERTGKHMNYKNPNDLNEKLMWLERYWNHPLKRTCSDKYLVRNYITELGLEKLLIPLIGVYKNASSIDFEELPNQFALKCNHGSGFNVICTDKSALCIDTTCHKLTKWLKTDYSKLFFESHYHGINPLIVCEELISQTAPTEYQFWCINGEPQSILCCRKNYDGTYESCSYSLEGEQLYDRIGEKESTLEKPTHIEELLIYAKKLAKPFPFLRADFYVTTDKIYFAEMTFSPNGNILSSYRPQFLEKMGAKLILPPKYSPKCLK